MIERSILRSRLLFSLIAASMLGIVPGTVAAQQKLHIPDTLAGDVIPLLLQTGSHEFLPGRPTATMGANGSVLGPTLVLRRMQQVQMRVENRLPDTTTIHWHGMHVSPRNDGGPHITIAPGDTWTPAFTVLDRASTYWYHPHLHHRTNEHVSQGLAGFIIVRDEEEDRLPLPRTYGVDDIPLLLQSRAFDAEGRIVTGSALDSVLMINATVRPVLDVPAQIVRLRLLNGASERSFLIGLEGDRTFHQIGSDAGLLSAPVALTRLMLSPGERAEILVDLSGFEGRELQLLHRGAEMPSGIYGARQPGMGAGQTITGYSANPINGANVRLLSLRVGPALPGAITSVPPALAAVEPIPESLAERTRVFTFMSSVMGPRAIEGPFMINGAHFDPAVINEVVPFNATEIWELRNMTPIAHPFHIHNVPFYVLSINGAAPPPSLAGRKDVILVPGGNGVVRFITTFETFYDAEAPYMYHCHLLTHEDHGMMGQFIVAPPVTQDVITPDQPLSMRIDHIHPNPARTQARVHFSLPSTGWIRLDLVDMLGRRKAVLVDGQLASGRHQALVETRTLSAGVYSVVLSTPHGHTSTLLRIVR